jgi:hypothetical protein
MYGVAGSDRIRLELVILQRRVLSVALPATSSCKHCEDELKVVKASKQLYVFIEYQQLCNSNNNISL